MLTEEELTNIFKNNYKLATKVCNNLQKHYKKMNDNFSSFCHYFTQDFHTVQDLFISCQDNEPCVYFKTNYYNEIEIRFHCVTNLYYSDYGNPCDECKTSCNFIFKSSCVKRKKKWCLECLSDIHNCGRKREIERNTFEEAFWPFFEPNIFKYEAFKDIESLKKFEKKLEDDKKYFLKLQKEKKNLGFKNKPYDIFKVYSFDEKTLLFYIFELKNIKYIL
jgi:hypothetical protein